uniref:Dynein light chain roadblock n=1 Tax=Neogobius melanostomus TaxID=47308 RepID=A0A8C6SB92_9GOBI
EAEIVEETLRRIEAHDGVVGTIVVNPEGLPIRTTMENSTTAHIAGLLRNFTMKAWSTVRDIDPTNGLTYIRICTRIHEIMVAPGKAETNNHLLINLPNTCTIIR